jgi:hypothetical protein
MKTKYSTKDLTEMHFDAFPLWRYDENDNLYYAISSLDEVPEEAYNFFIRAEFVTPKGFTLKGYLVSITKNYCIGVFYNGKEFLFNKNAIDNSIERIDKLIAEISSPEIKAPFDIFPLKYTTTIRLPGYRELSGEFDAFEKLKDKRILRWKKINTAQ